MALTGGATERKPGRDRVKPSPEHLIYARVLAFCVRTAFILLIVTFALYLTGVLEPSIPIARLPDYWSSSAAEFARATGTPGGWHWLESLAKGDALNMLGIALLAGAPIVSVLSVVPFFLRRGDIAHVVAAFALVLVLVLAAADVLP